MKHRSTILRIQDGSLFKSDLYDVYKDRRRKFNVKEWDKSSEKYKKLENKFRKSEARASIFKGKKSKQKKSSSKKRTSCNRLI
jgi:hypothetical protein